MNYPEPPLMIGILVILCVVAFGIAVILVILILKRKGKKGSKIIEIKTVSEKNCSKCKAEYDDDDLFCPKCGTKIKKEEKKKVDNNICKKCSAKLDKDDDFCPECGRKVKK